MGLCKIKWCLRFPPPVGVDVLGAPVLIGSPWMFSVVAAPAQRDPIVEIVLLFISTFRPRNNVMRFQVFGRSAFLAPVSVTLFDLESPCRSTCRSFVVVSFMRKRFVISAFNTDESGLIRSLHDLDDLGVSFCMALRADQRNSNKIIAQGITSGLVDFWLFRFLLLPRASWAGEEDTGRRSLWFSFCLFFFYDVLLLRLLFIYSRRRSWRTVRNPRLRPSIRL